jgi:hypothetical protein
MSAEGEKPVLHRRPIIVTYHLIDVEPSICRSKRELRIVSVGRIMACGALSSDDTHTTRQFYISGYTELLVCTATKYSISSDRASEDASSLAL